ncbi:glycosyltransferase family 4 protein [uncultured Treponema sp.]|uniref:glycosyltransferase family 4 protein n=1 Tax=uncultured Treponema sp. TaxID=162155 RepID=UPI002585D418|nr:glycosyltransferase family 4 protein [uncultured Treponema sp.]
MILETYQKQELLKEKRYILFLGRVVAEKRVDLLLKATKDLGSIFPDLMLVIAGPVEDEKIVADYRDDKNIYFYGPVFGAEKDSLVQNCFIFSLPSDLEGFSVSLVEAMAKKCLCLSSDIKANKEVTGDCGLYFKQGNLDDLECQIKNVYNDESQYISLKEAAYNRVKNNFTWDVLSERMINFYKECK